MRILEEHPPLPFDVRRHGPESMLNDDNYTPDWRRRGEYGLAEPGHDRGDLRSLRDGYRTKICASWARTSWYAYRTHLEAIASKFIECWEKRGIPPSFIRAHNGTKLMQESRNIHNSHVQRLRYLDGDKCTAKYNNFDEQGVCEKMFKARRRPQCKYRTTKGDDDSAVPRSHLRLR